jgi:uncharacterized protein YbaP (TraB family)
MAAIVRILFRTLCAVFAALLIPAQAFAADAPPMLAMIDAHPALWTVYGPKGTAYLFGSIHILPPNMEWHTPQIDAAMKASDVFVFEIPMDDSTKQDIADFVRDNGFLPAGTTLPSLLTPQALKNYNAALAVAHVPPVVLENRRPWLASLVLDVSYMAQRHLSPDSGVDRKVYAEAVAEGGKTFRAFETPEQQFALLMPKDRKLEVAEFDSSLLELLHDDGSIGNLVDAWADGDVKRLAALARADVKGHPEVEKALFDDRNRNWVGQIGKMLDEKHTFFITVGAGHLAGPKGVPALLRARGYRVDGP